MVAKTLLQTEHLRVCLSSYIYNQGSDDEDKDAWSSSTECDSNSDGSELDWPIKQEHTSGREKKKKVVEERLELVSVVEVL